MLTNETKLTKPHVQNESESLWRSSLFSTANDGPLLLYIWDSLLVFPTEFLPNFSLFSLCGSRGRGSMHLIDDRRDEGTDDTRDLGSTFLLRLKFR